MAIIINASDVSKYEQAPLFLQCKTTQEIIILNVPPVSAATLTEQLGYQVDESGNAYFSAERGKSYFDGEQVNVLLDLMLSYYKKEKQWKILIGIEHDDVNTCRIKDQEIILQVAVPEVVNFKIQFSCQAGVQYIESMLAIDLGNTRSCALLCNDIRNITHHSGMQIHKVSPIVLLHR